MFLILAMSSAIYVTWIIHFFIKVSLSHLILPIRGIDHYELSLFMKCNGITHFPHFLMLLKYSFVLDDLVFCKGFLRLYTLKLLVGQ